MATTAVAIIFFRSLINCLLLIITNLTKLIFFNQTFNMNWPAMIFNSIRRIFNRGRGNICNRNLGLT